MKNGFGKLLLLIALVCSVVPATAWAGGNNNSNNIQIPTLDGIGLASLAGGLAIAGSWLAARRRNKK